MRTQAEGPPFVLKEGDHLLTPIQVLLRTSPGKPLLSVRDGDRYIDRSVADVWSRIVDIAKGLMASGVGVGDRVALMGATSSDWLELDHAIVAVGAVTVPIYETSSLHQVSWILRDSGAVLAFVDDDALKSANQEAAVGSDCREMLTIRSGGIDELVQRGSSTSDDAVAERIAGIRREAIATIIYTSGTTGNPKGCILTHGNLRSNVHQVSDALGDTVGPDDTALLFLPLAHVLSKMTALYCLERGVRIAFGTSIAELPAEFALVQPTLISAVPRIFEKVYSKAQHTAEVERKGKVFERAARTSIHFSRERASGAIGLTTKIEHRIFDALVYKKIASAFGGSLRMAFSGGGPLGERLTSFFDGVGVRIYEGYGLTETSPILTISRTDAWRPGSVGLPVAGTSLKLAEGDEILAKGPQVFRGYWNNPQATAEVHDDDGWFRTGDVGSIDDDGYVYITGRIKDLIVTGAGKNVAPAPLEDRLRAHSLVSQAMVVGDGKPFIAALVTIDVDSFSDWAEEHGHAGATVASLVDDATLRAEIQEAIDFANESVSRAESIRSFVILPQDLELEAEEVTPTLKVRRMVVMKHYADVIETIYSQPREDIKK